MSKQLIEYHDGDTLLEGYFSYPDNAEGKVPLVVVAHAWAGRTDFECGIADKLAGLGYAGFALDNYGKGVFGNSMEENRALMTPLVEDRAMLRRRLLAGLEAASRLEGVDTSRIAAIGFCFGGLCVLDMARSGADLKGVVSFHGLFHAPQNLPNAAIRASILALHGYDDPLAPPDSVLAFASEMTAAGADWQLHAYGSTAHAFTNPGANTHDHGMVYMPRSAQRAFQTMENFLTEVFV